MFKKKYKNKCKIINLFALSMVLFGGVAGNAAATGTETDTPAAIGGVVRYVELKPTFIANFGVSDTGAMRYVRADVTVRVSNKDAEYAARYHLPALRNSLVLLLSRQDEATVSSASGRETLKAEALQELRDVLQSEEGEPHIEDLLFTNFVVQR
ncbi:MAG: flagellar basal body-associated FliL family protein [Pseudomonadota bacterium]